MVFDVTRTFDWSHNFLMKLCPTKYSDCDFKFLSIKAITLLVESLCQTSDADKSDKSDFPMDGPEDSSSLVLTQVDGKHWKGGNDFSSCEQPLLESCQVAKVRRT